MCPKRFNIVGDAGWASVSSLVSGQSHTQAQPCCLTLYANGVCEFNDSLEGGAQDYLHEAALANDSPSGTFYDPENDDTAMASLGVHEHWNNAVDKQYSRNLGIGNGIELIATGPWTCEGDFDDDGNVDGNDLHKVANGVQSMDFLGQVVVEFGRTDCW